MFFIVSVVSVCFAGCLFLYYLLACLLSVCSAVCLFCCLFVLLTASIVIAILVDFKWFFDVRVQQNFRKRMKMDRKGN